MSKFVKAVNTAGDVVKMEVVDKGNNKFVVTKKDMENFLDSEGVTKEVRKMTKNAENNLAKAAIEFLGPKVIKAKDACVLQYGGGDGQMSIRVHAQREFKDLKTGKMMPPKFGGASISIKKKLPTAFSKEGEVLDQINKDIEKALSKIK